MDIQQRHSRFDKLERILDFGSEEALINAKTMLKPLQ